MGWPVIAGQAGELAHPDSLAPSRVEGISRRDLLGVTQDLS